MKPVGVLLSVYTGKVGVSQGGVLEGQRMLLLPLQKDCFRAGSPVDLRAITARHLVRILFCTSTRCLLRMLFCALPLEETLDEPRWDEVQELLMLFRALQ